MSPAVVSTTGGNATEGFVKVTVKSPRVKAGGVLAKLEVKCEEKDREIESLKAKVVELGRDSGAKDEKIDVLKNQLQGVHRELDEERGKNKQLNDEVAVLKYAFHERKLSKKEIERITEQVRSSGFKPAASPGPNPRAPKSSSPDAALSWASHSIEVEIEDLISRLATTEARLAMTEEKCAGLEEKVREAEQQRDLHQRHTDIVLKDKTKLAAELQALKEANLASEPDDYFARSPLASKNLNTTT
ncbi:hypothetical protein HOP50_06g43610 [Chloropicon primus]|uniref:Uncharacterized protein n=1 Tax=Chloropicon primus TaxID=1764295 RepID=A0A5B8MR06_9CHLO|nr:hypothetical protein A3770_06p43380 [Chloropicon primus]UPR01040.1 hypothetical protein HOP50_06g43610 [Chloropicon primus]|eukprot:QDZ21820.1 hypothetical protein A3770_06p43380 [Chloropicon primus]